MSTQQLLNKKFSELRTESDWGSLLRFHETLEQENKQKFLLFKVEALLRLDKKNEAKEYLDEFLLSNPTNSWALNLNFEVIEKTTSKANATQMLYTFIKEHSIKHEGTLARCAELLRNNSDFIKAIEVNKMRKCVQSSNKKIALAIQTFNKADTLTLLFESLLKCKNKQNFALTILQDSWIDSSKPEIFRKGYDDVSNTLDKYIPSLLASFGNIEVIKNENNLGTAPSCVKLINHVTKKYDSFVFFEDDCIFCEDTLDWSKYALDNLINEYSSHFATCESVFFDHGKSDAPSELQFNKLLKIAQQFSNKYCELKFVPSTNFMTTSKIWRKYSELRRLPRGPESLNDYFQSSNQKAIFPIVARTSDIGMEHQYGFSTTNLGAGNVKEIKNSYIQSSMIDLGQDYELFNNNRDLLYSSSSKINEEHIEKLYKEIIEMR